VRQLANNVGSVIANYHYDGYGKALNFDPAQAATQLLYCGEMYDSQIDQYNLRRRWYNPANGRFNTMDPFAGSNRDPQSLHKYLYAHCNPINNVDPTGQFSLMEMVAVSIIVGCIAGIVTNVVMTALGKSQDQVRRAMWRAFWIGFVATAIVYSVAWTIHSIWFWIFGGQAVSNPGLQTELHHFASNCNSTWTPRFQQIVSRYGLSLNDAWNLHPFSTQYHSGPHPEAYHQWVFAQMTRAASQAGNSVQKFIMLFYEYVIRPVMENPEMLKPEFWQ
jgi:RHS repeat-associated protein